MPRPLAVAITGGIAAGKSETLTAFARHGAATISSDDIVHRLLRENEEVRAAVVGRWGPRVLDGGEAIDRSRVAEIVFADRSELGWLEALLHPRVIREYLDWRQELAEGPDPPALCVVEVPLLYEVGGETRFDAVVVVTAPEPVREARGRRLLQASRSERLIPDEDKVRRADYAYVNDGTLEQLDEFVSRVVQDLTARV